MRVTSILSLAMASSSSSTTSKTFYRRPLPSTCIALSSQPGRARFASALHHQGLLSFFPLMEQFTTQSEPSYCGISTLVMALNAFAIDPRQTWKGPWRWYTENMLNCCLDLELVKQTGITLSDFRCLALCQGVTPQVHYASESTIEHLRSAVKQACHEDDRSGPLTYILIASYNRQVLQQTGTGHFSPIAAYDEVSDDVLILDTARFKYGAHWVPLSLLFEAMLPEDPATGKSRGYILLENVPKEEEDGGGGLHQSMLVRSSVMQCPLRRAYKEYLQTLGRDITWEETLRYWTKDGQDMSHVWKILQAQWKPENAELTQTTNDLLTLLQSTRPPVENTECTTAGCRPSFSRTIPLAPADAIYLLYLASLPEERRRAWTDSESLLAEVELVARAIHVSDQVVGIKKEEIE